MKIQTIPVVAENYNLEDYEKTVESFDWTQAEEQFTWFKKGKMNIAYETIDRHAESEKANKVALLFKDGDRREKFTFKEMSEKSNKAANVLKQLGVKKGDRVFIFMPRSPDLYICLLGAIKLGAIVGPLFESFMDVAVFDRLNDSQAKVLITTSELVGT